MLKYIVFVCFISTVWCDCQKVFKTCSVDDKKCQIKQAGITVAHFANGNVECKIPPLVPMVVPNVEVKGSGLSLAFSQMKVYGLERGQYRDIKINPVDKTFFVQVFLDKGSLIGPYHLKGNLGPIVLDGQDNANLTAINLLFNWTATYDLEEKNGKQYGFITNSNLVYDMYLGIFQFNNIVRGNKELSKATNDAINADWRSVVNELGPGVGKIINGLFKLGLGNIMKDIPINEIFTIQ